MLFPHIVIEMSKSGIAVITTEFAVQNGGVRVCSFVDITSLVAYTLYSGHSETPFDVKKKVPCRRREAQRVLIEGRHNITSRCGTIHRALEQSGPPIHVYTRLVRDGRLAPSTL